MIKAPISLQELRRRIYRKAKAEAAWRFWGLYVHVCKLETLREAYRLAQQTTALRELTELRLRPSRPKGWRHGSNGSGRN